MEAVKKGGFFIYLLSKNESLKEEAKAINVQASALSRRVEESFTKKGNMKVKERPFLFFKGCVSQIALSKEMEYLIQAYALTALRCVKKQDEKGIISTYTEPSLLCRFSSFAATLNGAQNKLVEFWQKEFTQSSVVLLKEEAEKVTQLGAEEKTRMLWLLSPENARSYSPNPAKYEPKMFGCLFYEYKAILCRLKEEQALVCFKSIEKEKKPFQLLFRPVKKNESFALVADSEYTQPSVVIFEGVTTLNKEEFGKWILEMDFSQTILACAAIEAPYEPMSTLADVKNEEAQKEILMYREIYEKKIASCLLLDHVYASSLQNDFKEKS